MALITCKECGVTVSSTAQTCPKCGARVARKPIGCGSAIGIFFLFLVIAMSMRSIFRSDTSPSLPSSSSAPSIGTTPPPQVSKPEPVFEDVQSITVYGKKIKIGTTSDAVNEILGHSPGRQPLATDDKDIPGSYVVPTDYRADGKSFRVITARKKASGPYVVYKIFVEKEP